MHHAQVQTCSRNSRAHECACVMCVHVWCMCEHRTGLLSVSQHWQSLQNLRGTLFQGSDMMELGTRHTGTPNQTSSLHVLDVNGKGRG